MKKIFFSLAMLVLSASAFSQQCFEVLQPTFISLESNGMYKLTITYNTTGTKALDVVIKCDNNVILTDCFVNNGNGTKIYDSLVCPSGNINALLTPHAGSCNAATCASLPIVSGPGGGPLPVKISSFSAIRSKQVVFINWSTDFEIEAKDFIVERAEGNEFRSVGTIASHGNSSSKIRYSFNDKNENVGVTYYRLKNVDLNGRFTYSEIKTVKGFGSANDVSVYPNPARANSNVSVVGVTANSSIQLLDFSGKVLKNINSTSTNTLDLTGVKNGTYLIRIVDKATNVIINKTLTVSN